MFKKLFLLTFVFVCTILFSHEISIGKESKIAKERVEVKHNFTRDTQQKVVVDTKTRLMWQDDTSAKSVKKGLMDAKKYCYDMTLASYTNWRLPSIDELGTITDITHANPAIHKAFKNVVPEYYISSSPRLSDIDTILYMDFNYGHKYKGSRRGKGYVRCVRANKKKHHSRVELK